ncbi:Gfo/Idh/MocA family oxidoreductase [Anaerolineales bacterium HSG24]|nr:Gfo/Idh/MocA family oxidoreductase [Anaerolineales bacterium HSG24]
MTNQQRIQRKLNFGQIGGGRDSFIGAVHRRAAISDGLTEFVAGALSSNPEKAKASGEDLLLAPERNYSSWQEMLATESDLPDGKRIDYVSIVTPNHVHFEPTLAFIEAGFNVVLDKPMVHTSQQAQALVTAVEKHDVIFGLTHNYTGYPLVKEARHWVQSGRLGKLQRVVVEYPQAWLLTKLEEQGLKQAEWRTDPNRSGIVGAIGDIGTHCENLVSYITSLELEAMCADLSTFVPGRLLDDDASILLRFKGGAKGILWVSQIATGSENGLNIRIYGTEGALSWKQEEPNYLNFYPVGGPMQVYSRGNDYLCEAAQRATHLPSGHPEAFFESFGNIYLNVGDTIRAKLAGREPTALELDFPTVYDGARGVKFMEKVVESAKSDQKWTLFD